MQRRSRFPAGKGVPAAHSGTCPGSHSGTHELLSTLRHGETETVGSSQAGRGSPSRASEAVLGFAGRDVLRELRLAGGHPPPPATPLEKPPTLQQRDGSHDEEKRPVPEDAEGGRVRERGAQPAPTTLGRGGGGRRG